jgi:putative transposase
MPRQPRLRLAGVPLHIVQRGNDRVSCFRSDGDRRLYLDLLGEQCRAHDVALHAYVLMSNHAHLLMTPSDADGAGRVMKGLGERYVRKFNRLHRRTGTLWEGRFHSSLVDTEGYLLTCHWYIEMNPVRARMVAHPAEHPWSSYGANALGATDPLLSPHACLEELGRSPAERRAAYRQLFERQVPEDVVDEVRSAISGGYALGSDAFKQRMAQALGRKVGRQRRKSVPKTP